jgi:hypothetical protein
MQPPENHNTIERSALGRVARLGDLYDARSDEFRGLNLFKTKMPPSCVTVTDNPSCCNDFVYSETFNEKCEKLDVSAELKLSFLSGLITVDGSGKYLKETKTGAKTVKATWLKEVRTVIESLDLFCDELKDYVSFDVLNYENATHFVVQVHWGGRASLTLDNSDEKTTDMVNGTVSGNSRGIETAIKSLTISASAGTSTDYTKNIEEISNSYSFKLHGDIIPDESNSMQMDLKSACAYVSQLSTGLNKANDGKGKPMKYLLFPLSDRALRNHLGIADASVSMYKQVAESSITRFVHLFDSISFVEQQVHDLASDVRKYQDCLTPELVAEVHTLQVDIDIGKSTLRSKLADTLKAVRSGSKEQCELDDISDDYLKSEKSFRNVQSKLEAPKIVDARRKLDFRKTCADYGVNYVRADHSIDRELIENEDIYVMYASDELMTNDEAKWRNHLEIFFDLVKGRGSKSEPAFMFVDCNFNKRLAEKEGIRIRQFRNNRCVCSDVQKEMEIFASSNVAQTSITLPPSRDAVLVDFTLPCPGSLSGHCDVTPRQWLCRKRRHQLQFGIEDDHFHCPCGRAPFYAFAFRCRDKLKHNIEDFIAFEEQDLRYRLDEFKRSG